MSIYTENGYCISVNGEVFANSMASSTVFFARKQKSYLEIFDSSITYTIPVNTEKTYRGSKIVAVSVIQNLSTFLDDMDFSSFDENAYMYLTDQDGVVISKLTNEAAPTVFNIMALMLDHQISEPINESSAGTDMLAVTSPTVYQMTGAKETLYVVSSPIETQSEKMHLFYFISKDIVNKTMNSFTRYITFVSGIIIFIVIIFFASIFIYIYQIRRRQFDEAVISREHMFELLVSNTKTAFGLFHTGQRVPTYISSNTKEIIGMKYMTIGHSSSGYYLCGDGNEEHDTMHYINSKMKNWDGKSAFYSGYVKREGSEVPGYYELQLYPAGTTEGEYVGIALDVTEAYERENAAKEALIMAESANEAKTRFLSNMSHDIRTPMNAIVNMTGFAIESIQDQKKTIEYLKTISESSAHLLMLINDILDMSRIESGKAVLEHRPFHLKSELLRLRDIVQPLCDQKNQKFYAEWEGLSVDSVLGDRAKVAQIFMNLLSNAVKYTQEGGTIRFTASQIPSLQDKMVDIRFSVEDNGMGISEEFLEHMFEPFSREDENRISKIQGTGLGLSICHSYVVAMGGHIKCESEENKGSTFTVELFFEKAETMADTETAEEEKLQMDTRFTGKRCLLCEDNVINQMIAQTILERLGFAIDITADGKEGTEKFLHAPDGYYDVIYMDIQMPVMNGYEATRIIRESEHPQAASVPIIAMTANVFAEDIEKARVAGMNGHIAKPFDLKNMIMETKKVMGNTGEEIG
ncbi:MAG: ATP-binding protein [bacterium]|nr:ATP-binding protein [bacterium]